MKPPFTAHIVFIAAIAFAFTTARADFGPSQYVPVDRLVKKAGAYREAHKDDGEAWYLLGRIHYLAFYLKKSEVPAYDYDPKDPKPKPAAQWSLGWARSARGGDGEAPPPAPSDEELLNHASAALLNFTAAIRLDPKNGLYQLGFASFQEAFWKWRQTAKSIKVTDEQLLDISPKTIGEAYAKAFTISMEEDKKLDHLPTEGVEGITACEAATALLRLKKDSPEPLASTDPKILDEAATAIKKFEKLPAGPITPIVFSFRPVAHLADLLDPARIVDFDLRGYGPREQWSWMKPDLGFLVWDPARSGDITSASQLFGTYTFQLFWKTGYAALAALDDNSDGRLTGEEMRGIGVWFDRNGDGRSTPDEVIPAEELGIVSLAVNFETRDGIHPTNPRGLTLRDGRTLRTWDWITTPHLPAAFVQNH